MKHQPLCNTNMSCAVLHSNGVCPDKKICNCNPTPPTQEKVSLTQDYSVLNRAEDEARRENTFIPPTKDTESWEKSFRDKDFYRIMNGNAPITDMIEYIRQRKCE